MSYDEHLISMAGGDGEPVDDFPCCSPDPRPNQLDAIKARANDPFGTLKRGIGQVDADRDALLEIVQEQAAQLQAARLEAADAAYTRAVQAAVSGHGDWAAVQVAGHAVRQARSAKKEGA